MTRAFPALLIAALLLTCGAAAAAPTSVVTLSVISRDPLPGFRQPNASEYLTSQMRQAGIDGWEFFPATIPGLPPRDRVEWHFELDPYASGGVRQFFPMPQVQRLFGARHLITAEAMLYLDNEYQTLVFGQATIQGGEQDKDLAAFVVRMTQQLLGEHGAYRSIDMAPALPPSLQH